MKTKPTAPIIMAVPSTIDKKMEAIVELSKAMASLASALESTHIKANIVGCTITGAKGNAIQIGSGE